MIEFDTLTIRNFLSFGNAVTTFVFDEGGTTLIVGENLDSTKAGSGGNGCGKTVIINALAYALYGKPISTISLDHLINNVNKKNMEVTLTFRKGTKEYKIERARKAKAGPQGNYVRFYIDGVDKTRDSSSHTNTEIEKILGFTFDIFERVVVFSATSIPFFKLPTRSHYQTNQTDIIEQLFDLKRLSTKAEKLKKELKNSEQSLETKTLLVTQIVREHKRHNEQIENTKKRISNWDKSRTETIKELTTKLEEACSVDLDQQQTLHRDRDEINRQLNEIKPRIASIQRSVTRNQKKVQELQRELEDLNLNICPLCKQRYHDDSIDEQIRTKKEQQENLEKLIKEETSSLEQLKKQQSQLSSRIKKLEEAITVQNVDELISIKSEAVSIKTKIQHLNEASNPHADVLDELNNVELDDLDKAEKELNELRTLIEHQQFLLKLLTKKDSFVRKRLLDKYIPYLNKKLQGYLSELGLPHKVEFTHEMTARITQFGNELDFGNLSNGQQARVNIALSFAFRDVLRLQQAGTNVCLLDEILDVGLDAVGVQLASSMLKRISRDEKLKMYIISHRDEASGVFDNRLTVQLSKGFSYIINEE